MILTVNRLNLPFYIVSGGIKEIIEAHFKMILETGELNEEEGKAWWDKVGIFSNEFKYDNDTTIGFKNPIVHVLNKREIIYKERADFRRNVIILGDIIEDVGMVHEEYHDIVLKIGYLNDTVKYGHLMSHYLETYDLLITGDGTLYPPTYLLQWLYCPQMDENIKHKILDKAGFRALETLII